VLQNGYQTAMVRALTAVPAHALFGVTMGYYLGIARMYEELRSSYLSKAVLIPVILHGIYDFILMVQIGWLLMLFIPYVVYLYMAGMKKMKILSETSIFKPPEEES
jgi:RsiW-degrading membrane proteinase PrsW (M82 family)